MIRSLYIAQSGLDAQQFNVDVISNNLANVSTNGFKRQRAVFQDLLYQTLRQPGAQSSQLTQYPTGLQVGTGVAPVATARMFTQGNLQQVGGSLNVAIEGRGFFQILLPNGNTAYTRDGGFQLDNQGQIVTSLGFTLQPTITIPADAHTITIGGDGTVSVTQPTSSTPDAGRHHPARRLHQPGRPAGDRQQPVPGDGLVRAGNHGRSRHQRPGRRRSRLPRSLQRQRDRGAGRSHHGAARVRDQLPRGAGLRRDAAAPGEPG